MQKASFNIMYLFAKWIPAKQILLQCGLDADSVNPLLLRGYCSIIKNNISTGIEIRRHSRIAISSVCQYVFFFSSLGDFWYHSSHIVMNMEHEVCSENNGVFKMITVLETRL